MFRVSCIQLRSTNNIHQNLKQTEKLIIKAVKHKTDFICLNIQILRAEADGLDPGSGRALALSLIHI